MNFTEVCRALATQPQSMAVLEPEVAIRADRHGFLQNWTPTGWARWRPHILEALAESWDLRQQPPPAEPQAPEG